MTDTTFNRIVDFIRTLYDTDLPIPIHEPLFSGNEKKYLSDCIDSTFVSYLGEYVNRFEKLIAEYCGVKYAIATITGTSALHISLKLANVQPGDFVITQPLTFIATVNSIRYLNAEPYFLDIDPETLGMSPESLKQFLENESTTRKNNQTVHRKTGKRIAACLPVHTFGHPVKIDEILRLCNKYNIPVVEDAAEGIGSTYRERHVGTFGLLGILSFNGNKIITTGGGGMILTNDENLAWKAKHLTTQAKVKHTTEIVHDEVGYNYRLPNLNAAVGCAQMERIDEIIHLKRDLASQYSIFFSQTDIHFFSEPEHSKSNYWLNSIICKTPQIRNVLLSHLNDAKILARPAWKLMTELQMYRSAWRTDLSNSHRVQKRLINIPSSIKTS